MIQAELSDVNCTQFGYTSGELKAYLAERGYRGYRWAGGGTWTPVTVDEPHPKWENALFLKPPHRAALPTGWRLPPE